MLTATNNTAAANATAAKSGWGIKPRFVNGWATQVTEFVRTIGEKQSAELWIGSHRVGNLSTTSRPKIYRIEIAVADDAPVQIAGERSQTDVVGLARARSVAYGLLASLVERIANDGEETVAAPVAAATRTRREHRSAAELREMIEDGSVNLFIVGPAGTGKTTLAADIANDRNAEFGCLSLSGGVTESALLGRILPQADGAWRYQASEFVRIYEGGGVFLLDEIDAADPNVLVAINAALANGFLIDGEGKRRTRHASTIIIAAANTYGTGADAEYVGRSPIDAATRDRFVCSIATVGYDGELEREIATDILRESHGDAAERVADHLVGTVERIRETVAANRMRRVISTRFVVRAATMIRNGRSNERIVQRLTEGWSDAEVAKIRATLDAAK